MIPEKWGPDVWTLLHSIAESIGILFGGHIGVEVELLIRSLPAVLPCAACQVHAREYIAAHPPKCRDMVGVSLQSYVRRWLWEFHEAVNVRVGKPAGSFPFDRIGTVYSLNGTMTYLVNMADAHLRRGVAEGIVRESAYMVFRRHLDNILITRLSA